MQPYGPLTLTANTLTRVQCSPASTNVYVGNDSPFDVLVSFSVSTPSIVTAANGNPEWASVVQAFHHAVLPTPANIGSPQGSGYTGNVWLLPINTRNTTLASNGTISSTANAWVVACLPGETPPDAYAAPRQTDITSQARVITVPIVPTSVYIDTGSINVGTQLNPFGGTVAASNSFGINIWCYIHSFTAQQFNSTVANARWQIGFAEYDNSNNLLASHRAFEFATTSDFRPYVLHPAVPWVTGINTPNPNTRVINLYIKLITQSTGTTNNLLVVIQMAADIVNVNYPPPPIGGGANQLLAQAPGGIY